MGYTSGLTTASINGSINSASPMFYEVSDTTTLINSAVLFRNNTTSYVKAKQFTLPSAFGLSKIRIAFTLSSSSGSSGSISGRIYKNGEAFGTERTTNYNASQTWTEDLVFSAGDTIEIWCKQNNVGAGYASISNFKITGTLVNLPADLADTTITEYTGV